jgi:3-hydroxyisobutyrate dehydrogenase
MAEKIGFVGVGRMGSNMARRLKECGYPIAAVYDVNTAAAQSLAQELGCEACSDLRQVTKLSDVIITVVTDDKATKKIYTGGLLSRSKGKLFINCATITPSVHVWVEGKAEKAGAQSLEACMASSITQAREGTL